MPPNPVSADGQSPPPPPEAGVGVSTPAVAPVLSSSADSITAGQMSLVLDVARLLTVTADLDPLLKKVAEAVTALLDCERASIFLHDAKTGQLWTKIALGRSEEIRIPSNVGIVGHAFGSGEVLHVPHPYQDPRFNPEPDRKSGFVTRNLLAAPMFDIHQGPVGVIQAVNKAGGNGRSFTESDLAVLQLLAAQAGVALQRYHLQQAAVRSVALEREMQLARSVQLAQTPSHESLPKLEGYEAAGWTQAASINGGDCYDLWRLSDGRIGILVADASGHGLAPALVVSQVRMLVRALAETEPDSPYRLLQRVNTRMYEDLPSGRFVTAFVGYLSRDGTLNWCSAGHGPVLIRSESGAGLQSVEASVPPLGVVDELEEDCACDEPLRLKTGGSLLVMSDGITEAFSPEAELFGNTRLLETLEADPDARPEELITNLRETVRRWQGHDEPADDQTVVALMRTA